MNPQSGMTRRQALLWVGSSVLLAGHGFGASRAEQEFVVLAGHAFALVVANPGFVFANGPGNKGQGEAVALETPYWLGRHQVTNAQYQIFVQASNARPPKHWQGGNPPVDKADHPVLFVSALEAEAYCQWLGSLVPAWRFRLPSEAEWENAARGPNKFLYPWGNTPDSAYNAGVLRSRYNYNGVCAAHFLKTAASTLATYNRKESSRHGQSEAISSILAVGNDGVVRGWIDHATWTGFVYTDVFAELSAKGGFTTPVGAYPEGASACGCHDMAGNAYEWTSSLVVASNGAESGRMVNAVRGGSWYATGRSAQTSQRGEGRDAKGAYNTVGFRVLAEK